MPRGGSKKGEHRGNAKARAETPNELMRDAIQNPPKPRPTGKVGRPTGPARNLQMIEQEIFISQVIQGVRSASDMTPKEIMLDNMHYFQNAAYENEAMMLAVARAPDSEDTRRMVRALETEVERNRRLASDEAYKVAPFIHPRLAAIAVQQAPQGNNIVKMMLDEIDKRNRERPMVIEHDPQKRSA